MDVTTTWKIEQIRTMDSVAPGFVTHVVYSVTGVTGEHQVHLREWIDYEAPGDQFIPLESLTEAQVIQWVLDHLGPEKVAEMYENIRANLDSMVNPPIRPVIVDLPWSKG